jgi:hypothetical protein
MKSDIHVETPDGQVLKTGKSDLPADSAQNEKTETADKKDLLAGPKPNPDPFANANLEDKHKTKDGDGPGTEVTDGEDG